MAGETTLTIIGNLVRDPETRNTPAGHAVTNFTIASTPRTYDRQSGQWVDGDPLFLDCSAWRQLGEHAAESLRKGMRVVVQGRLKQRSYDAKDGTRRTVVELDVEEVGPSLRYATAQVTKANGGQGGGSYGGGQQPQTVPWGQQSDAAGEWAGTNNGSDRPPF